MALYVINSKKVDIAWHVGGPAIVVSDLTDIVEIQADGQELQMILLAVRNLPHLDPANCPVQSWYGETAIFIAKNLRIVRDAEGHFYGGLGYDGKRVHWGR